MSAAETPAGGWTAHLVLKPEAGLEPATPPAAPAEPDGTANFPLILERLLSRGVEAEEQVANLIRRGRIRNLAGLEIGLRTAAAERLTEGYPDDKAMPERNRDALSRLWRTSTLDPDFARWQEQKNWDLAETLAADPRTQTTRSKWPDLSEAERLDFLTHVVRLQTRVMGGRPVEVTTMHEPGTETGVTHGVFDDQTNGIRVNTAEGTDWHNFTTAVGLILHETFHALQSQWEEKLKDGKISAGSPLHKQARLFSVNHTDAGYVEADADYAAYLQQPLEDHAEGSAQRVLRLMLSPAPLLEPHPDKPSRIIRPKRIGLR